MHLYPFLLLNLTSRKQLHCIEYEPLANVSPGPSRQDETTSSHFFYCYVVHLRIKKCLKYYKACKFVILADSAVDSPVHTVSPSLQC